MFSFAGTVNITGMLVFVIHTNDSNYWLLQLSEAVHTKLSLKPGFIFICIAVITTAEDRFSLCWFVCLFVCQQNLKV